MNSKQNTLTDAELLILLEGDVSDVDLNMSDDELDHVSDRNEHEVPTGPVAPGLNPEMIEARVGEKEDLDDVSLSLRLQISLSGDAEVQVVPATSNSGSRSNLWWHMKDTEEVDGVCNTGFSDPPNEEITPFEYFKQMWRDELKTSLSSPICIVYRKQEGH
jgi:hypothetical protein